MLSVVYKILSEVLKQRIERHLDKQTGEYQAGFRKGRSCVEQIFVIKYLIKNKLMRNIKKVFMTFVDFKKYCNTLIEILREFAVDEKSVALIRQTLTDTYSQVLFLGDRSEPSEVVVVVVVASYQFC